MPKSEIRNGIRIKWSGWYRDHSQALPRFNEITTGCGLKSSLNTIVGRCAIWCLSLYSSDHKMNYEQKEQLNKMIKLLELISAQLSEMSRQSQEQAKIIKDIERELSKG
jgi:hypothetical protein